MSDETRTSRPAPSGAAVGAAISRIGAVSYGTTTPTVNSLLGAPGGLQNTIGTLLQGFATAAATDGKTRSGTFWGRTYSVPVGEDGAIVVRAGDWLSKYSVAMFSNIMHVPEFGRKDASGAVRPVENPDLIYVGETIYHIPTYEEQHAQPAPTTPTLPQMTPQGVEAEMMRFLRREYELPGEHLEFVDALGTILNNWVDWGSGVFEGAQILELLGKGGNVVQGAGKVLGVLDVACQLMNVLECWKGVLNAQETLQRIWGMMAVAYTTTAWGFDDSIPTHSPELLAILRDPGTVGISDRASMETECMNAWAVASASTIKALEKSVTERYRQEEYLQGIIRALGKDVRADTCDLLKQALYEKFQSQDRNAWVTTYRTKYPG